MTTDQIAKKAIDILNKRITNEIFLIIQNDKELMYHYLRAVEEKSLDVVNRTIGKKIRKEYSFDVDSYKDLREHKPSSTLIQSHQIY